MHAAVVAPNPDRLAVADEARRRLQEERGMVGRADLALVARRVVHRDRADLAGAAHGRMPAHFRSRDPLDECGRRAQFRARPSASSSAGAAADQVAHLRRGVPLGRGPATGSAAMLDARARPAAISAATRSRPRSGCWRASWLVVRRHRELGTFAGAVRPALRDRLVARVEAHAVRAVACDGRRRGERFQPPNEWNAIGTGIGTLMPTMPALMWRENSRAASPSRVKMRRRCRTRAR